MSYHPALEPSTEHPVLSVPVDIHLVVRLGGVVIADTHAPLSVQELGHAPRWYVPRGDVRMDLLRPSSYASHCPRKGDASWFDIVPPDGAPLDKAVWSYETPLGDVAAIKDCLSFYDDRMPRIAVEVTA